MGLKLEPCPKESFRMGPWRLSERVGTWWGTLRAQAGREGDPCVLGAPGPRGTETNPWPSGPTWQEEPMQRQGDILYTGAEWVEDT